MRAAHHNLRAYGGHGKVASYAVPAPRQQSLACCPSAEHDASDTDGVGQASQLLHVAMPPTSVRNGVLLPQPVGQSAACRYDPCKYGKDGVQREKTEAVGPEQADCDYEESVEVQIQEALPANVRSHDDGATRPNRLEIKSS